MYEAILWFAVGYIFLCKFNYGYHNHLHQYLPSETYFSHKIWHRLWEKYELSCEPKSPKVRKIGLHTLYTAKFWMKNNIPGFTDINLLSVQPCMLFFIQTWQGILCAGAVSPVSFLHLFGLIDSLGKWNVIMYANVTVSLTLVSNKLDHRHFLHVIPMG